MKLVIVTGLSGSGKSTALHTLEDLGYYCIDNLPVSLLRAFSGEFAQAKNPSYQLTAVGIDARTPPDSLQQLPAIVETLRKQDIECRIVFLEARDEILIRRFSETRRKHPLTDQNKPLAEAIQRERQLLEPLLATADLRIDSSEINIHELRDQIRQQVTGSSQKEVSLLFQSFGYKHGIPANADFVYDARCLSNPHWEPELRPLCGRDKPVADYLEAQETARHYIEHIKGFLEAWIPAFEKEGRSYLTIAIGCTGGRHRSVYLVEQLAKHFQGRGQQALVRHRDLQ